MPDRMGKINSIWYISRYEAQEWRRCPHEPDGGDDQHRTGRSGVSMDTTIMNTTMPRIAEELGDMKLYAWSFASYMILEHGRNSSRRKIVGSIRAEKDSRRRNCAVSVRLCLVRHSGFDAGAGDLPRRTGHRRRLDDRVSGDYCGRLVFNREPAGKIQAFFTAMWGGYRRCWRPCSAACFWST